MCQYLYAAFSLRPSRARPHGRAARDGRALADGARRHRRRGDAALGAGQQPADRDRFGAVREPARPPAPRQGLSAERAVRAAAASARRRCTTSSTSSAPRTSPSRTPARSPPSASGRRRWRRRAAAARPGLRDPGRAVPGARGRAPHLAEQLGEDGLFIGPPWAQAAPDVVRVGGVGPRHGPRERPDGARSASSRRARAASATWPGSHYGRFVVILEELVALREQDPAFEPAHPVTRGDRAHGRRGSAVRDRSSPTRRPRPCRTCSTSSTT